MEPKTPSLALTLIACLLLLPLFSHARILTNSPSSTPASRVAFLQHLKGCHKGDKLNDIPKLKAYLHKFGYLDDYTNQTSPSNNHYFDGRLENALKTYQANYHLNVTGAMDSATVASMMTPRCGVADIVNGTNYMQTRRRHGTGTTARYNFFPGNPTWPEGKRNLTYGFLPGTPEMARDPVARAFKKWGAHSRGRFAFVATEDDHAELADIKIGFFSGYHGDTGSFDGPGGSLAHSSPPKSGLLHFDSEETWAVGSVQKAFDVETVALHEIGHILGLMHSSVPTAIMYPAVGDGVTKELSRDDVHGFRALYKV
ncbi:unnamed protein product [Linum tenue]|uniref:Peptidase metallopeptidase domain-containing protein n=1 Tax=Linum tenue TaxID=586396 RepID=A0AAV0NB59_9ROSI|nr:unnamed protein product [Linum tenue]